MGMDSASPVGNQQILPPDAGLADKPSVRLASRRDGAVGWDGHTPANGDAEARKKGQSLPDTIGFGRVVPKGPSGNRPGGFNAAAPTLVRASIVHVPDALKPDAIAYGVATGSAVPGPLKAGAWIISPSGNPFQFSAKDGNTIFVSKPVFFASFKGIRLGHGGVATYNPVTKHFEAGWGGAANLSIASIPVVVWLNARISDVPPNFNGTVSANLGAAVSVDQLTARGLLAGSVISAAIPTPPTEAAAGAMAEISGGLTAAGKFANEFVGVGYRAEIRFKDGKPEGIYYHGKEFVDLQKFAEDALKLLLPHS